MGPTSTDVLPSPPCSEENTSEDFSLCISSPRVLTTSYQFIQSVVHLLGSLEVIIYNSLIDRSLN